MRIVLVAIAVLISVPESPACTFCSGPVRSRPTLRLRYAAAKVVAAGVLKNPRFDPQTDRGYTDFHFSTLLKDDPARGGSKAIVIPQYLPVVGDTPPDYLFFGDVVKGKLEPMPGLSSRPAIIAYLKASALIDHADPIKRLGFFFPYLDSKDPTISQDAFIEFARASDGEILKAAGILDAAVVRNLIANPQTPVERLGVYAFLLGVCGKQADAKFLGAIVKQNPLPEKSAAAFGGLLAGYVMLAPREGWAFTAAVLAEEKRGYAQRLSALGTVRFFQAARTTQSKAAVLRCCAALLPHGDLADQAIEDLRRWGYWDLTKEVLGQFGKRSHSAPIVKRSLVRYALTCPQPEAKAFIRSLRQADPKLVRDVEEMLARFAPAKK